MDTGLAPGHQRIEDIAQGHCPLVIEDIVRDPSRHQTTGKSTSLKVPASLVLMYIVISFLNYRPTGGAVPNFLLKRPEITDKDLEGKSEEEQEMLKLMGFSGFDSTKVNIRLCLIPFSKVTLICRARKFQEMMSPPSTSFQRGSTVNI